MRFEVGASSGPGAGGKEGHARDADEGTRLGCVQAVYRTLHNNIVLHCHGRNAALPYACVPRDPGAACLLRRSSSARSAAFSKVSTPSHEIVSSAEQIKRVRERERDGVGHTSLRLQGHEAGPELDHFGRRSDWS